MLVLLTAEITIRASWRMSGWVERPIYQKSNNPYLRYELAPNSNNGLVYVNSGGFRGRQYPVKKPANTFRIIMLGDSETFSFMLKNNETLPAQLETILNEKSTHKLNYEVLNFGVEGYCTLQELEMLKTKGLQYSPDLIILNYVLNDPEPGEYYFNKTFLMRHSALVRYFTYRIKKGLIKRERKKLHISNELENYNYYHQPKYFDKLKEAILEMAKISRERGRKLVVVIFPTSSTQVKDFKQDYPYKHLHELVKSIDTQDIVFIDLLDEFNRLNLTPQAVSINYVYDESHKNPAALKVACAYIYKVLKAQKLIPQ
jgi:hypothetical protein